jgi:transcriptional antiterminator NusG
VTQGEPRTCDQQARSVFGILPDCLAPTLPVWYALRLRSRADFVVAAALADAGIETFFPTYTTETRWVDRVKFITKPLFGGYIFIRTAPNALHAVRRIAGVVQVLGYTPTEETTISDAEIASLRIAVASRKPLTECPYVAGQLVRVTHGPMAGSEGVVTRSKGVTRIVIAIEMLCRAVSLEIDANDLEPNPRAA